MVVVTLAFVPSSAILVRVDPLFGYHRAPVRVLMTRAEAVTVDRMQRSVVTNAIGIPRTAASVEWLIEPSAVPSRTLDLSRKVLARLQFLFEDLGLTRADRTFVVVGRSQKFINETLESVDCFPNLVRTGGVHLMGAAVCNRRVIVINLTGYFFLLRAGDALTSDMETKPEPRLSGFNYKIADRNISGLAHEWVHVARASAHDGRVAVDEPAWVREGFAELMAGIARVLAFAPRMDYLDFHVVRLRKFADWGRSCPQSLRRYREDSDLLAGCEYYLGAVAMEYLVAQLGGLPKVIELFRASAEGLNFGRAFRETYGISLDAFEARADAYLRRIADLPDPS